MYFCQATGHCFRMCVRIHLTADLELTNSHLGQMVSVFPSSAPTPRLAAALVLRISTSEAIGAGFPLDIVA